MGKYACILADPPWRMSNAGTRAAPQYKGKQRKAAHYQTLSVETLISETAIMVGELAAADAFLWLWAPNALVLDYTSMLVAKSWGFDPKQLVPWIKTTADGQRPALGMGNYTRVCSEQLLLCRRGRPAILDRSVAGVIFAPRTRHSAKPDESYELIEKLCAGPRIELFARRKYSEQWDVWGNDV